MLMRKLLMLFLSLLSAGWLHSQSLAPEVIASAGEHFATANAQLSWTVGEPVIETYTGSTAQLTQGFHQTNLTVVAVNDPTAAFQVSVFPNPTAGTVSIEAGEPGVLTALSLFDAGGRLLALRQSLPQHTQHTLDLSGYPAGTYYLQLQAKGQNATQTFKIIKSN